MTLQASASILHAVAVVAYLLSTLLLTLTLAVSSRLGKAARIVLLLGFAAQTTCIALQSFQLGGLAVTTTREALFFYSWAFVLVDLLLWKIQRPTDRDGYPVAIDLSVTSLALVAIALASSPLFQTGETYLMPALRSHWLSIHVSLTVIGEGFFAVAFVASLAYLIQSQNRRGSANVAALTRLDRLSYRMVSLGMVFFTLGALFFGAIWAKHAWGSYWSWDPKETFSLVTWLVYVLYLHQRVRRPRAVRSRAWIAVCGFLIALFTFAGVNYLISGLHSYV